MDKKLFPKMIADKIGTNSNPREVLRAVKSVFPNQQVSESILRLETKITNSPVLTFPVSLDSAETTTRTTTEIRLGKNDLFVVTKWGLYLKKVTSNLHGSAKLHTYPQPVVFADNSTTFIGADLEAIYNSQLSVNQGTSIVVPAYPTFGFRQAPANAQGDTTAAIWNSTAAVTYTSKGEEHEQWQGMRDLAGFIIFEGPNAYRVAIEIPDATSLKMAHTASNTDNWLTLQLQGVLVKSCY